jgi:hypothetical protein
LLPTDWRTRMVDMIRGAQPPDPTWFSGGPFLSPQEQIEVYQEQFRLRFLDVLAESAAGTRALFGDAADELCLAYLAAYPPSGWTLEDVDQHLAAWLESIDGPPDQIAMAKLDRAVSRGFIAGQDELPRPEAFASNPRLGLQPHVTLLLAPTSVHRFRSEILMEQEVQPLVPGPFYLAIFRVGLEMRHLECEPAEFTILQAFASEATVEEAVGAALAAHPESAVWMHRVGAWFQRFAERGLLRLA